MNAEKPSRIPPGRAIGIVDFTLRQLAGKHFARRAYHGESVQLVFTKKQQGGQGRIQSSASATGKQPKEIIRGTFFCLEICLTNVPFRIIL